MASHGNNSSSQGQSPPFPFVLRAVAVKTGDLTGAETLRDGKQCLKSPGEILGAFSFPLRFLASRNWYKYVVRKPHFIRRNNMLTVELTLLDGGRQWAHIKGDLRDGKIHYREIVPGKGVVREEDIIAPVHNLEVRPIFAASSIHHELDGMPYRKFKDLLRGLGIPIQAI